MSDEELRFRSEKLPAPTLARSVFDSHLMRLSDKGGASQVIGEAWSDVVAEELSAWLGNELPVSRSDLRSGIVRDVTRLDTIPGIAARASRLGLKNPDFLVRIEIGTRSVVIGVDSKFSVETAQESQVSVEATSRLFDKDERLAALLPSMNGRRTFGRGLFVCPDYNLTRAMFRQRMGHRRMTVERGDVVLVDASGPEMFASSGSQALMRRLIDIDALPINVWTSLLAGQYYFRLGRAMHGLARDEQLPLLGHGNVRSDDTYVLERVDRQADSVNAAWDLLLNWDRDVDHIRRQRQALHQVVGSPVSSAELRALADVTLSEIAVEVRPSRNRIRKALGSMFTNEVIDQTGVILPFVNDFPCELERVASISRDVAKRYRDEIDGIVRDIVESLISGHADLDSGQESSDNGDR